MGSRPAIQGSSYTEGGSVFQGNNINVQSGSFSVTFNGSRNDENETQRCLTAMFLTDSNDDRERIINLRGKSTEETCTWILTTDQYENWQTSYGLLWISGGPGKGKTMLSISLAEHIAATINQETSTLLQFYCDSRDERRNTAVAILRSLIFQLVTKFPSLLRHVIPVYNIQKKRLFSESSFESLWRIFKGLLCESDAGEVNIILDGLDECEDTSLELLLRQLQHLFRQESKQAQAHRVRIVVTSREHDDCCAYLDCFPRIRLEDPNFATQIESDLHRFISTSVKQLAKEKSYPDALRNRIEDVLTKRAKGTFLWVSLVIFELKKKANVEVSGILDSLPSGLHELYGRILLQIRIDRRQAVSLILHWVALAVRPLTLAELAALTHVQPGPGQDLEEAMTDQIMFCRNLLGVDGGKVYLAHESVKDFLQNSDMGDAKELGIFHIKPGQADLDVAEFCINYMNSSPLINGPVPIDLQTKDMIVIMRVIDDDGVFDPGAAPTESGSVVSLEGEAKKLLKIHPLLAYAMAFWTEHVRRAAVYSPQLDFQIVAKFCQKSPTRNAWLRTLLAEIIDSDSSIGFGYSSASSADSDDNIAEKGLKQGMKLLRKVARTKVGKSAKLLVRAFEDDNNDTEKSTVPSTRFSAQHSFWEKFTLKTSSTYRPDQFFGAPESWSALHIAACFGVSPIVDLLLNTQGPWWKGQLTNPVHQRDGNGLTPLMWATLKGDTRTMTLLLARGADVNTSTAMQIKPLHLAAVWSESATRLLLDKGALANVVDQGGLSPLHFACRCVDGGTITLLLEHGAKLDARDKEGRTPLHLAAETSAVATKILVAAGANVNVVDENGDMPFDYAAQYISKLEIAMFLLDNGAIIDSGRFRKVLFLSAEVGDSQLAQELLAKGANPNINHNNQTPLSWSFIFRNIDFASTLLRHGADINFRLDKGRTVLHVMAARLFKPNPPWHPEVMGRHGYIPILKFIISNGADINCQDDDGDTPLHVSVSPGVNSPRKQQWVQQQSQIVSMLIEAGADVTLQNKNGLTPLDMASLANVDKIPMVLSRFSNI